MYSIFVGTPSAFSFSVTHVEGSAIENSFAAVELVPDIEVVTLVPLVVEPPVVVVPPVEGFADVSVVVEVPPVVVVVPPEVVVSEVSGFTMTVRGQTELS